MGDARKCRRYGARAKHDPWTSCGVTGEGDRSGENHRRAASTERLSIHSSSLEPDTEAPLRTEPAFWYSVQPPQSESSDCEQLTIGGIVSVAVGSHSMGRDP